MTRMPPPSFHRNKFSVLNTLLSQTPVCIFYHFLPPFLTFFHTFLFSKHYIPHLSSSGRTSVCPRSHQSQHAWLLPNLGYVCLVFFVLFSTCCLLFCRTVITFSFYSIYQEDVRVDGVDAKTNMHFERDDTQPHSNTDIAYCSHRLTKLSVFSWGLHIYAHKSRISWIGNAYSTILWKLWKTSVCVCRHIPKQRSVIYKDKWMSNVCCCRKLRW